VLYFSGFAFVTSELIHFYWIFYFCRISIFFTFTFYHAFIPIWIFFSVEILSIINFNLFYCSIGHSISFIFFNKKFI